MPPGQVLLDSKHAKTLAFQCRSIFYCRPVMFVSRAPSASWMRPDVRGLSPAFNRERADSMLDRCATGQYQPAFGQSSCIEAHRNSTGC